MGQRSVPAPFLTKTYDLVDDGVTNDVISWGDEGTTFVVWKTAEFAKDLLPKYFKHNNFSSFVRQLNTYGFRKIVPDKWEFANDNFKRDDRSLLVEIRRRKTSSSPADKLTGGGGNNQSQSASGDDAGSTSTSPATVEVADLSGENDKLKRDNEMLSSELARTKKQCDGLVAFLTRHLNVGPEQIDWVLQGGASGEGSSAVSDDDDNDNHNDDKTEDSSEEDGGVNERKKIEEEGLKLFGVWLKEECGRKRGRCGDLQVDSTRTSNNNDLGLNGPDCGRKFMRSR